MNIIHIIFCPLKFNLHTLENVSCLCVRVIKDLKSNTSKMETRKFETYALYKQ